MTWEAPTVVELKMDAEVGSYQDDFDRDELQEGSVACDPADAVREHQLALLGVPVLHAGLGSIAS